MHREDHYMPFCPIKMKLLVVVTTAVLSFTSLGSAFAFTVTVTATFTPLPSARLHQRRHRFASNTKLSFSEQPDHLSSSSSGIWNPSLRKIMAGAASFGALETAYLTYNKLNGYGTLCGIDGSCGDVLNGPYATVPGTDIPLSALGCGAYTLAAMLAMAPLLVQSTAAADADEDTNNRIALLTLATAMATFSTFLMSLLVGFLHVSCPFCVASAVLSWTLGACAWFGGCLPARQHVVGLQLSAASFLATTVLATTLFVHGADAAASAASSVPSDQLQSPPTITTTSSERALALAQELEGLDARMFGAFWCSHCFDQKMSLGKEAFKKVEYVECAKDGVNSQTELCKERKVPGYPTWEIGGKLFPGEQDLEELEDIVQKVKSEQK
jgi:uncharacterized membrane protein